MDKALIAFLILTIPQTAFAYLDPGTGSMMVQAAMGILFAGLFYLKRSIAQIKQFITKIRNRKKKDFSD
jgi:hypothetical protein